MRRSEKFTNLMAALNEAKAQMRSIEKKSKNPHFKSTYADINEVFDVIKEPLYNNRVAYNQFPDIVNGQFVLTTILMHLVSGEYMETDYQLLLERNTSQGQGSALTYAKRQALAAIFSLHEFDDDGNAAEEKDEEPERKPPEEKKQVVSNLPQPNVKSLMQKYSALYKVPEASKNPVCLQIYQQASHMKVEAAQEFISHKFKEHFGDKSTG